MALVKQMKKGGRYTKKEQEEMKIEVYQLHFEEHKPATKIAELLNVNRNTINDYIHYWNQQFTKEFKPQDLTAKMTKQIQRKEIRRDRLFDDLEDAESFDEKFKLEKFIDDIDNTLIQLFSNMISSRKTNLEPTVKLEEIDEDEIKEFVRNLILLDTDPDSEDVYSEDELKFRFIKRTKCDITYVNEVIEKMKQDGLVLCEQSSNKLAHLILMNNDVSTRYRLTKFALLRGYVTIDEIGSVTRKRIAFRQEIERDEKEREEKFIIKYGPKSQWSEEVKEMFDSLEDLGTRALI